MRNGARWVVVVVFVIVVAVFAIANSERGRILFGRWSFTKSVDVKSTGDDRATYYRLKVNLAYKGEPLDFDIVVGCNVRVTTYKDNDRTVEVGVAPMAFGLKMKDGHGVVVRPPQACRGETTENGKVPVDLLPFVVTYENADQPWFGLGYASEDAYASPISELKFFGATISNATHEEWQAWRGTGAPKNFVTYELLGINERNRFDQPHWKPGFRAMSSECTGFSWVRLPEPVREGIRPYWPASKPRYWYPNENTRSAFRAAGDYEGKKVLFEGNPLREYLPATEAIYGVARHKPGGLVVYTKHVVGNVYPAASDLSLNRLTAEGELPAEIRAKSRKSWAEASVDPKLKGFAYCDVVNNIEDVPLAVRPLGQTIVNRVNGEPINEDLMRVATNFDYAFDRDEYVFFYKSYPLVNIWGGL
jgi:hypothetical protein